MPRGGRRVGAGRKPKHATASVLAHPSSPMVIPTTNAPLVVEAFDAPDSLSLEERAVWMRQAPFAFALGTLTRASAVSFERYCRVVVLEQHEAKSSGMGGANHRGLLKQINSYELQFMLTPVGKPMPIPASEQPQAKPESALARFRR